MQKIYLVRHFPNYLEIEELSNLPKKRIEAYYKKHRDLQFRHPHESYPYSERDLAFNSEFGTNAGKQLKEYFNAVERLFK